MKTGLAIVDGPGSAYRVAKESYGPLNPQERGPLGGDRSDWYRFDTPGRTIYAAEDPGTAFLEALSWARMTAAHRDYLEKTAAFFDAPVTVIRQEVEEQWHANGHMAPGWIPATWRDGRLLYGLQFGPGRWIDIAHVETITALSAAMGGPLYEAELAWLRKPARRPCVRQAPPVPGASPVTSSPESRIRLQQRPRETGARMMKKTAAPIGSGGPFHPGSRPVMVQK